ncbi:MAG: U2 snRNP-associated SURP domain-containing protein [Cirrosporium novae-zelandiae]|nr:MAG: U2 snRNP-associated SURP domain-containing protein [Cirrosporium novae-zelandiae]
MPPDSKIKEFPDISNKLTAPTKKSIFERQKAEAEAKRRRERDEAAAVYQDFVKSFEEEDNDDGFPPHLTARDRSGGAPTHSGFGAGGPSKRHFTGALRGNRNSGPGSLGPPPSLSRKRAHDGSQPALKDNNRGMFAFDEPLSNSSTEPGGIFQGPDDEDDHTTFGKDAERAAPKPTLHLASLPPGTTPGAIKALLPKILTVDNVKIIPPSAIGGPERRTFSAIVTLAKDTPASDIDTVVNTLQNKYLGRGFCLSISRHLSSAAISAGVSIPGSIGGTPSLPFGATPIPTGLGGNLSRAPPPSSIHRGGFAPPQSFHASMSTYNRGGPSTQVKVSPPGDLRQLKLIHKTLEALLTHGPEFEALLMSRADVQKDERWAWLWNPRSQGGVWYRWKLWEILTGSQVKGKRNRNRDIERNHILFEGEPNWVVPERPMRFEYVTDFSEFVSDSEYDSSEEDESDDEAHRRHNGGPSGADEDSGPSYLNPLQKTKLTHLLARLPTSTGKLRKGDVARVTSFAIEHAGSGADEVVEMIVSNIEHPFAYSKANPSRQKEQKDGTTGLDDEVVNDADKSRDEDTSSAKLIALYIVSDILSSSSTSGVRHAWRYRQLFEIALKDHKIFEQLGRLDKVMEWGRLRAEKWKRSVSSLLSLWEGWCVFPQAMQEHFASVFTEPPLTEQEKEEAAKAEKERSNSAFVKSKWKAVDEKAEMERQRFKSEPEPTHPNINVRPTIEDDELNGKPMQDVDGEPMDDDLDGEPMDDFDGELMDDMDGDPMDEDVDGRSSQISGTDSGSGANKQTEGDEQKAEDMFAESDGD